MYPGMICGFKQMFLDFFSVKISVLNSAFFCHPLRPDSGKTSELPD